jgi:hypothetical protein
MKLSKTVIELRLLHACICLHLRCHAGGVLGATVVVGRLRNTAARERIRRGLMANVLLGFIMYVLETQSILHTSSAEALGGWGPG